MTEEIIIDVSNCPHKSDDDCMEVPICNEYGDLMGYQSCEAQTLCPYRSQKKIERLEQENKELGRKAFLAEQNVRTTAATFCEKDNKIIELEQENEALQAYKDINEDFKKAWDELNEKYKQLCSALEEIRNYCDRIEQGSVIGTQDCLINSIKNITNEVLNEKEL